MARRNPWWKRILRQNRNALLLNPLEFESLEDRINPSAFHEGDLAVLVASASRTNTTATIVELDTTTQSQSPVQYIPIPGSGANALRISGSSVNTGYLSLTDDDSLLAFTGANTSNTSSNVNTLNPRAVGTLDEEGAFAIPTTYTGTSGKQTRSATSIDNSNWLMADQAGIYTNDGTTPNPADNFRSIRSFGGTVYAFMASNSSPPVGAIASASFTPLPGLPVGDFYKQDFYMIRSGANGSAYDVLYLLSSSSNTAGTIAKYSLVNGAWAANGSYSTTFGGFGITAAASSNGARLFVSTGEGALTTNSVMALTDTAGYNQTISINSTENKILFTTSVGSIIKGVSFTPHPNVAPTSVSYVVATEPDGYYNAGKAIHIEVHFSSKVNVTGSPKLALNAGPTERLASYSSGSGTDKLVFEYDVQPGDSSTHLTYETTSSLMLNGGTITDSHGSTPNLALPADHSGDSLGDRSKIEIDTEAPTVLDVNASTPDGSYGIGAVITLAVSFGEPVTVTGAPSLLLETGATDESASYSTGSGTTLLYFTYTVQPGDNTIDLDYSGTNALVLNSGSIVDPASNPADPALPSIGSGHTLAENKNIVVDAIAPAITSVSSTDGAFKLGTTITIIISFSEPINVTGFPQLLLETGDTDEYATYSSGTGSSEMSFSYTVKTGDESLHLDYTGTNSLGLNGGTIADAANNKANIDLPSPGATGSLGHSNTIVVDGTTPSVTDVNSSDANATYGIGSVIHIFVDFSEPVWITGTPQLWLNTTATGVPIDYALGSGTTAIEFVYTVSLGDSTSNLDYFNTSSLTLNGGSITDAVGNAASLDLPADGTNHSLNDNTDIQIDGIPPSIIRIGSLTPNGEYRAGNEIQIAVQLDSTVTVSGSPLLELTTGVANRFAIYSSGSGTNTLIFIYTIQQGDNSTDLDYTSQGSLMLNGGMISDESGNEAILTLPENGSGNSLSDSSDIVVDTDSPRIANISSTTDNGTYKAGDMIDLTVQFNEPVVVSGSPVLVLNLGDSDEQAKFSDTLGLDTLIFQYTVQPGDTSADLDYSEVNALELQGASVSDRAGNPADLTLYQPGKPGSLSANKDIVIDTTAPTIVNVTSTTPNGFYKAGGVIAITIQLSEAIIVSGIPLLTLNTGGTGESATMAGMSGADTLIFDYTVRPGDNSPDLNYLGSAALSLDGGTISDIVGNFANLTLPEVSSSHSLAVNKDIVIDTEAPSASSIMRADPDPTNESIVSFSLTFDEAVTGVIQSDFTVAASGISPSGPVEVSGSGNSYRVSVPTGPGDGTIQLTLIDNDTILDQAGNLLGGAGIGNGDLPGATYTIDRTPPNVGISVSPTQSKDTNQLPIRMTATFSEPAIGFDSSDLVLSGSAGGLESALVTVTRLDEDGRVFMLSISDLTSSGTVVASIPAGNVSDLAGNENTASTGNDATVIYDNKRPSVESILLDSTTPSITNHEAIEFDVAFDEPVIGLDTNPDGGFDNFALFDNGPSSSKISSVAATTDPARYIVTVNDGSGDGSIRLDLTTIGGITDKALNPLEFTHIGDQQVTIDRTAPICSLANITTPRDMSLQQLGISFSEPIVNFDEMDLSLTRDGIRVPFLEASLSCVGSEYTLSGLDATTKLGGLYTLTVEAGGLADLAGNAMASPVVTSFIVDLKAPVPTIVSPELGPTNSSFLVFSVQFGEAVNGMDTDPSGGFDNLTLELSGTLSGFSISSIIPTVAGSYLVTIASGSGVGRLKLILDSSSITDLAGNATNDTLVVSTSVLVDRVPPSVLITDDNGDEPLGLNAIIVYSLDILDPSGVNANIESTSIKNAGTAAIRVVPISSHAIPGGAEFTFNVTALSGGTIQLEVLSSAPISDGASNQVSLPVKDDDVIVVDGTAPTVTVERSAGQSAITNQMPLHYLVTFSEPVVSFDNASILLASTGDLTGSTTIVSNPTEDQNVFDVTVSGIPASGTVSVSIAANAAKDRAGNGNMASTSIDNSIIYDPQAPRVESIVRMSPSGLATNASQVTFEATFSEPVTGVDPSDFQLTTNGVEGASIASVSSEVNRYFVTVDTGSGNGSIRLDLIDNDSIVDLAANILGGAGSGNGDFVSGESFVIDRSPPAITSIAILDPVTTNLSKVHFLISWSEPVAASSISKDGITADRSGVNFAGISIAPVSTGETTLQAIVTVEGINGNGFLGLSVSGSNATIVDLAGNSLAGEYNGPQYTIDQTPPLVTISPDTAQANPSIRQPIQFQVIFSEPVLGFVSSDVLLSGTAGLEQATVIISNTNSDDKTFDVAIGNISKNGTVGLSVPAGVAADVAGNWNSASEVTDFSITLDSIPPEVSIPKLASFDNLDSELTNDSTPTFVGTATLGATVTLFEGGTALGSAIATNGSWSITSKILEDGAHSIRAVAIDSLGNISSSGALTVTVDTRGPLVAILRNFGQGPVQVVDSPATTAIFLVTSSEPITAPSTTDFTVAGTAGGTITNVLPNGSEYEVVVDHFAQPGTVTLGLLSGLADLAGNPGVLEDAASIAIQFSTQISVSVTSSRGTHGTAGSASVLVTSPAGTTPGGTVQLTLRGSGRTIEQGVNLTDGSGKVSFGALSPGSYTVTAEYQAETDYAASSDTKELKIMSGPVGQYSAGVYGATGGARVTLFSLNGNVLGMIEPFAPAEAPGGVHIAVADVTGDGIADLIAVNGPGSPAELRVFDGQTDELLYKLPLFDGFTGGAFVAAGDVTGDGRADIAVTPDNGGGARVLILNGPNGAILADFLGIDDPDFRGGAQAAVGDMNGDGIADVIVSAGFGGGPRVAGFDGASLRPHMEQVHLFHDFFAFEQTFRNGATLSIGDLNGDGFGDVIAGGGFGGGPRVRGFSGQSLIQGNSQTPLVDFFAGNAKSRGGVRIIAKDLDGDGHADIVSGSGDTGDMYVFLQASIMNGIIRPQPLAVFPGSLDGVFVG